MSGADERRHTARVSRAIGGPPPAVTGAILAGGCSRRMGRDKALLPWGGMRLLDAVAAALAPLCRELLVVAPDPDRYGGAGLRPVADARGGASGPLVGLHAALRAAGTEVVLLAACDAPLLQPQLLRGLVAAAPAPPAEAVVPVAGGCDQPLVAIYSRTILARVDERLAAGARSLRDLLPHLVVRRLQPALWRAWDPRGLSFRNVNTPRDLAAARRALSPRD
ncbi:MAG: molybdenum cofactor guanylyltransferase [Candidatus Krumholzibacteriia bacterium]